VKLQVANRDDRPPPAKPCFQWTLENTIPREMKNARTHHPRRGPHGRDVHGLYDRLPVFGPVTINNSIAPGRTMSELQVISEAKITPAPECARIQP